MEKPFCGLSEKYSGPDGKIVLLPIPFDLTTTYQKGTDLGPKALIEASYNLELYDIETDSEVYRQGIYTAPFLYSSSSEEMLKKTFLETKKFLEKGKFVVVVGGEHSISSAPIKAHGTKYPSFSVLQFDAHSDLVPAYEKNPLSHASVMSRVKEIPQVDKIVSVGIRSMAAEEKSYLDRKNTFFAHEIHEQKNWVDKVVDSLSDLVYITFDLDVFDSSIMPSTGTPEPGGLFWHQVTQVVKKVAEKKKIIGLDVVELCPIPSFKAPDFLAAKLIYKTLSYIFAKGERDEPSLVHEKEFQTL